MSDFPLDCLGVVVEFVRNVSIIHRLLCVSKSINHFLEVENPKCCENVEFVFLTTPKTVKLFVSKLRFDKNKPKTKSKNFMKKFPNVKRLHINEVVDRKNFTNDMFLMTPKLEKLVVESMNTLLKPSFQNLQNLRILEYDHSHLRSYNTDENNLHTSCFQYLENLETLKLCGVKTGPNESQISDFSNLKKLRKLYLTRTKGFTNSILSVLGDRIEVLKLIGLWKFTLEHFEKLTKVEKLMVDEVYLIESEKKVVDKIGRKPKIFLFRETNIGKGDVASLEPLTWD